MDRYIAGPDENLDFLSTIEKDVAYCGYSSFVETGVFKLHYARVTSKNE